MDPGDRSVVQPLPRVPGPAGHGVGKVICVRHSVRGQNVLTVSDVPPDVAIAQQVLSEKQIRGAKQANEQNIGDRGQQEAQERRSRFVCERLPVCAFYRRAGESHRHGRAPALALETSDTGAYRGGASAAGSRAAVRRGANMATRRRYSAYSGNVAASTFSSCEIRSMTIPSQAKNTVASGKE